MPTTHVRGRIIRFVDLAVPSRARRRRRQASLHRVIAGLAAKASPKAAIISLRGLLEGVRTRNLGRATRESTALAQLAIRIPNLDLRTAQLISNLLHVGNCILLLLLGRLNLLFKTVNLLLAVLCVHFLSLDLGSQLHILPF